MSGRPISANGGAIEAIARLLRDSIGMRAGAISRLRLEHAAIALAAEAGVGLEQLPALLAAGSARRQELVDRVTVQGRSSSAISPASRRSRPGSFPGSRIP